MIGYIKTYMVALIVFFCVDIVWLVFVAKKFYQNKLGFIMSTKPNWWAAIIFYLIFIVGLVFFVIHPAEVKGSWQYALLVGMLFGFVTYATYDLTNLATLKDWPMVITVIDMIWGSVLGGLVSVITFFVVELFN